MESRKPVWVRHLYMLVCQQELKALTFLRGIVINTEADKRNHERSQRSNEGPLWLFEARTGVVEPTRLHGNDVRFMLVCLRQ